MALSTSALTGPILARLAAIDVFASLTRATNWRPLAPSRALATRASASANAPGARRGGLRGLQLVLRLAQAGDQVTGRHRRLLTTAGSQTRAQGRNGRREHILSRLRRAVKGE